VRESSSSINIEALPLRYQKLLQEEKYQAEVINKNGI
jgi:hypothetical protein